MLTKKEPFSKLILLSCTFAVVFLTKLQGYLDVPLALLFVFFVFQIFKRPIIEKEIFILTAVLIVLCFYSSFISLVHGAQEIIWPLKFMRTAVMAFLLLFLFIPLSKKISYDQFSNAVIWFVIVHSIIVYFCIINPSFRSALYSITGYVPRGPEWSRSPGLTISFNATAIIHVTALWFIARAKKKSSISKVTLMAIIIPSLIFLGRTTSYLGLLFIIIYSLKSSPVKFIFFGVAGAFLIGVIGFTGEKANSDTIAGQISINFQVATSPLQNLGSDDGVDSYFSKTLVKHLYFSDDWKTLVFGNSLSGHMGVFDGKGETDSDIGIINSINANGVIITLLIYAFYLYLLFLSRHGDWPTVAFIILLTFALSLKETGLFTSHVTPLLFLIVYYQIFDFKKSNKNLYSSIINHEVILAK